MNFDKVEQGYAGAILRLLTGVLSSDDTVIWEQLISHEILVRQYFERIGLDLFIQRQDGYAYLSQPDIDDGGTPLNLPRLTRRISLTYEQTMMCLLLREALDDFDAQVQESLHFILSYRELSEKIEPYIRRRKGDRDIRKVEEQIKRIINRMVDLGFLRPVTGSNENEYVVQRVLKARVTPEDIAELKPKLLAYAQLEVQDNDME